MMTDTNANAPGRRIAFLSTGTPEAEAARLRLIELYGDSDADTAEVVVALGGDGLMLQTLHRFMHTGKPIYGMNRGSVGFLMNDYREEDLIQRIDDAESSVIHPLAMIATDIHGKIATAMAINEVSVLRQSYQAAKIRISVDGKERLLELIADGVLLATPAGSSAYNLSVDGPIPATQFAAAGADANLRLPAATLARRAPARFSTCGRSTCLRPFKRPVAAVADHFEFKEVIKVEIAMDHATDLVILHDPGHSLDERILREQFGFEDERRG